jgi:hypothetical protein
MRRDHDAGRARRALCGLRIATTLLLMGVGAALVGTGAWAQGRGAEGPALRSVDRPVEVALGPTYQYYETEAGRALTQASSRLTATVPIGQRVTVEARAGYARMGGDRLSQVGGLTDAVGQFTYARSVGEGSIVASTTVNAPVGKQRLAPDALRTTRLVSRNFYDFRVSSYSRGLSVSPRVTWAVPVTDRLAVGLGAGYQHQRGFEPRANRGTYVPGDAIEANAGADYKLSRASALGVDVAYRHYAPDRFEGIRSFDAGGRVRGTVRYLVRSGFTAVRVVARYASWAESTFGYRVGAPDRGPILPAHALLLGRVRTRLSEAVDLRVRASGHRYDETLRTGPKLVGRLFLSPIVEVADGVSLAPRVAATYGSYLGLSGGLRIEGEF